MSIIKFETIENKLIKYHDKFVIVDKDVAELYNVATKEVNQAVSNNPTKFPNGYVLELTKEEKTELVKKFDRFSKLKHSTINPKELSRNINAIMKTEDETRQKELALKSNQILEDIIEIEPDILAYDEDGEVVETTTKFEFNLGFAKVSRSIKKIKK
ncbi:hypothetical protein CJ672_09595 [Arcobacter cryaerophilus gv. occultus]|uniref:ORF6N domain-containing protein n=1 Tax=Aliarcobacter cryaerophilus TaxID=28198 RepID=UPI000D0214E9|nr:ORF6N domain-containing protein [Aliarcobacter cryaerophilus]PRM91329.1 hypothetical protein CJ672_09595 [Arcobacter cryaerophilus gv. occultus]